MSKYRSLISGEAKTTTIKVIVKKLLSEKRLVNSIDNSLNPINYDIINMPQNTKGNGYIWYPMSYERHADKHFLLENRFWWYSH